MQLNLDYGDELNSILIVFETGESLQHSRREQLELWIIISL